jgi:hypothetical protein
MMEQMTLSTAGSRLVDSTLQKYKSNKYLFFENYLLYVSGRKQTKIIVRTFMSLE